MREANTPWGNTRIRKRLSSIARMRPLAQVLYIGAVLSSWSSVAACQSTLPPMAPTMREIEEHPATVEYSDGRIAVVADNSSLNEILRDVARRAGMAVRGSVVDERVFGTYGPAAPAEVLTKLLQGTDSNMVVLAGSSHVPELILSPKQGGPTPPRALHAEESQAEPEVAQNDAAKEAARPEATSEDPSPADDKAAVGGTEVERAVALKQDGDGATTAATKVATDINEAVAETEPTLQKN